jgi:ABC-2 type transport system permease protein
MNVLHIAVRELKSAFSSAVGWLVLCGWLLVTGLFWISMVQNYVVQSQDLVFNPYAGSELRLADYLLGPFFGNCAVLLIMVIPAISMRLFAEEVKQRTLELLLTSPISTLDIVLGKFLGAFSIVILMLLGTLHGPAALYLWASPDPGPILGGYAGLALLGSALLSLGLFASACTANQIVAMVATFAGALALLSMQWMSRDPSDLMAQISILGHLNDLLQGAVKLSDVVYYLAFTGLFLFATHQRMESYRWK